MKHTEILKQVEVLVRAADDRLAKDIVVLDVAELTPLADYFVVMSANNERQIQAVVESILEAADKAGIEIKQIEGKESGRWVLIDAVDVILHVFSQADRAHYNLENMWRDAPLINISEWVSE